MPDQKLFALCHQISIEKDPQKLTAAIDDLTKLLIEEQDVIKAKINYSIGMAVRAPE
jgi:hypothetical protein